MKNQNVCKVFCKKCNYYQYDEQMRHTQNGVCVIYEKIKNTSLKLHNAMESKLYV